ncbi:MAG: AI-2E family transporter [Paludibacteraceae bacterium]|nr:AI-2E family transporter [Paludibacteraceae bacterium]MBQ9100484.1 AI-2E family transporter [Paludibacteraceae bacterium]MBR6659036.1 AI-2E family transporter [Paludibacteraceae bacterium]
MESPFSKPFNLDRTVRLFLLLAGFISILLLLNYLTPVLIPFFVAWLLAYLLYPIVTFFKKKLRIKNHNLAVILVLLTIFTLIIAAITLLTPLFVAEVVKVKDLIIQYSSQNQSYGIIPQKWEIFLQNIIIETELLEIFNKESLAQLIKDFFPHAWTLLSNSLNIATSIFAAFITILYLYFILKDYNTIGKRLIQLIPDKYKPFASSLLLDMEQGMSNYYRGQSAVAMCVGILFCIGFSIINMPLALMMGLTLGLLNMVPYLQVLGIPPCIVLILINAAERGVAPWGGLIALAVVFIVVQIIQDGYLVPKIMKKTLNLNAAVILLALSVFGMLLGILGIIIALPATTLLLSYYKRYILKEINDIDKDYIPQNTNSD